MIYFFVDWKKKAYFSGYVNDKKSLPYDAQNFAYILKLLIRWVSSFWAGTRYKPKGDTHAAERAHFLKEIGLELHYNPYLKSFSLIFFVILRLFLICDYAFYHTKTEIFIPVKNNHPVITVTNCPSCIIVAISTNDIVLECLAIDFKWKI